MEIYLDNSSTTRCFKNVKNIVSKIMIQDYGNTMSIHNKGIIAKKYIINSIVSISDILKVNENEIFFTSGGTESNNWAIIGSILNNNFHKKNKRHIITTVFEHTSISILLNLLKKNGFDLTIIPVDKNGNFSINKLKKAIRSDTFFVSTMYINNEIGAIVPIQKIAKILHKSNPRIIYHVDAIQAYGKYIIHPKHIGIDLLSISGHKIHGPKGIGILYINSKIKINPLFFGGGQQLNMRSGTCNVSGIVGLNIASINVYKNYIKKIKKIIKLKLYFIKHLLILKNVIINGPLPIYSAPHIINISFLNIINKIFVSLLNKYNIYVSIGSACSLNNEKNNIIKTITINKKRIQSSIRFSLSEFTTKKEIDYTLNKIKIILNVV